MRQAATQAGDLFKRRVHELGGSVTPEFDQQRQRFLLFFVTYVTSWVMLFFAVRSFANGDPWLYRILCAFIAGLFLNIFVYHMTRDLTRACHIGAFIIVSFALGLVYHGGHDNTALYWLFPYPPLLFGLLGASRGLAINMMVAVCLLVMLFWPDFAVSEYRDAEKPRFMASLIIVIVVGWLNESGRHRHLKTMDELQRHKDLLAHTDALTKLFNRRYLDHALPRRLDAQPEAFFPLALIICDLDHFKRINDHYGHAVGDQALQHVATLFNDNLRQQDIACRYGGEEFLLLLPQCQTAGALQVAESLRHLIETTRFQPDTVSAPISLTGSFGVCVCDSPEAFQDTLRQADAFMYTAKQSGRNRVSHASYEARS